MVEMRFALLFVAALLAFGCLGAQPQNDSMDKTEDSMEKPGDTMEKPEDSMDKGNESMAGPGDSMGKTDDSMEKPGDSMNKTDDSMAKPSGYVPFTKSAYEQARADGKTIFLEFYANWCPICAAQAPALEAAFSELDDPDVIAFRVNYKDSDTDADEQALAREFGITYQHTHIILDSEGEVAKRSQEEWSKETILSEVRKVAG